MEVEIIKHFISSIDHRECGIYMITQSDGFQNLVIQNGSEYKAMAFIGDKPIAKCLMDITDKAKNAIRDAVELRTINTFKCPFTTFK